MRARVFEERAWSWQDRAACKGAQPEVFFPLREADASSAITLCGRCPVRVECLSHALEHDERYGVWGGMTERERATARTEPLRRLSA